MNKIKIRKCNYHPKDRDISHYSYWLTDWKGRDIYECTLCRDRLERDYERSERIREHNKRQNDEAFKKRDKISLKKSQKILKSMTEDLWDSVVQNELCKGLKLKGRIKDLYKERIPKEVLQLTRATINLNRLIEKIKKRLPSKKEMEQEQAKKQAEIDRANREPIITCCHHGDLFWKDVIKSGKDKITGKQRFKCRECMRKIHREHYKNNKEKVKESHLRYKNQDPEKHKKMKNESQKKTWARNKEKYKKIMNENINMENINGKNSKHETIER